MKRFRQIQLGLYSLLFIGCTPITSKQPITHNQSNQAQYACKQASGTLTVQQDQLSGKPMPVCQLADGHILKGTELYHAPYPNTKIMPDSSKQQHTQRLIITYDAVKKPLLIQALAKRQLPIIYDLSNLNMIVTQVPSQHILQSIQELKQIDGVIHVEQDQTMHAN